MKQRTNIPQSVLVSRSLGIALKSSGSSTGTAAVGTRHIWFRRAVPVSRVRQWESSLRAERTLASSWSAEGRASGFKASMSKSRAHMAGPGGGGSGGALLNFIGMHSWRSAFSHRASPRGMSHRPLHT